MSLLPEDNLLANVWHVDVALVIMSAAWDWEREGQINEKEQCGEGQLANANNLIEIVLQASLLFGTQNNYRIQIAICRGTKRFVLPLGVAALCLLLVTFVFWVGVVNTFLLGRAFLLMGTGVRGRGNAKMSTSLSWAAIFSLFSLARSWPLSVFSWRGCLGVRPLSGVVVYTDLFSTDGDASL